MKTKQLIYIPLFILISTVVSAQSPQSITNYVVQTSMQESGVTETTNLSNLTKEQKAVTIGYFDGLGRPLQNVSWQASPGGKDIIQPIEYDKLGREAKKYLPYTRNGSGAYDANALKYNGNYTSGSQYSFYQQANDNVVNDYYPYSSTVFDSTPLSRVVEQGAPGEAWQPMSEEYSTSYSGHTVKIAYGTNTTYDVMIFKVVNDVLQNTGGESNGGFSYYYANKLFKTITKDENWTSGSLHTTEEYKDKQGQVVLKRTYVENSTGGIETVETYYVYDDYGLLRFVLPPEAVAQMNGSSSQSSEFHVVSSAENLTGTTPDYYSYLITPGGSLTFANGFSYTATTGKEFSIEVSSAFHVNSSLIYSYKYDGRKRMIEKTIPGADAVYMVYDKRDRLVAIQDGEMRKNHHWLATKYDVLNRPIATIEIYTTNTDRTYLQDIVNGFYSDVETNASKKYYEEIGGTIHGYTDYSYPQNQSEQKYLTVTYYDNYDWLNTTISTYFNDLDGEFDSHGFAGVTVPTVTRFDQVKGQVTGTKTKVLDGTSTWLQSVTFYDDRYRPILLQSDNYVGEEDIVLTDYDFTGKVMETWLCHTDNLTTPGKRIIRQVNDYDHAGRLLSTSQQMTGELTLVTIAQNSYNELGELTTKSVGQNSIQQMDYKYNIRGWLTQINDPTTTPSSNKKFSLSLSYNTTPTGVGGAAQYNGNISAMVWRTPVKSEIGSPLTYQNYGFTYDALNRLKTAHYSEDYYGEENGNAYDVSITGYDYNGNILGLTRRQGTSGQIDNLTYNYAGNQLLSVSDAGTGTKSLGFNDGNTTPFDYSYDLNGNMTTDKNKGLSQVEYNYLNLPETLTGDDGKTISYIYSANGQKLRKVYHGSSTVTTNYAGNFVYEGSSLKYILHGEGKYVFTGTTGEYQYDLKDHLGNVRLVVNESGTEVQQSAYYPFGMAFMQGGSSDNKYLYNGKELQDDLIGGGNLDWYDYGARMYDPALGRWSVIDNKAEKYTSTSPYTYALNNPVIFIDPDGREVVIGDNTNQALTNLAQIAATRRGSDRLKRLVNRQEVYRTKSVYWSGQSSYDAYGEEGIKRTIRYVRSPIGSAEGGALSSMYAMGHETDHAWNHSRGKAEGNFERNKNLEESAVSFTNYLRSVYGDGDDLRTDYDKYQIKLSGKEAAYNWDEEYITDFKQISSTEEDGAQALTFSYNVSFNKGKAQTNYIYVSADKNGVFSFRVFNSKEEYDSYLKEQEEKEKQ